MAQVLCQLPKFESENLIVGLDTSDDAAVYKINDEQAIIQTLDFFTPVVDDPYMFGQIAAANSLSDVYAMGGKPLTALNIVCFPSNHDMDVLTEIMRGGADKVREAGALLVGGHTVDDEVPKYGLSVIGMVHPSKVLANNGAKPGDVLILTKPIGTGILNTAIKAELLDENDIDELSRIMALLNKTAAEGMETVEVNGCTDITGFGLAGHIIEMSKASHVTIEIEVSKVITFPKVIEHARMGIVPGGTYRNRDYLVGNMTIDENLEPVYQDIIFDPQTSGGLLVSLKADQAELLMKYYEKHLENDFSIIGCVKAFTGKHLIVNC